MGEISRRKFIEFVGVAATAALAGCAPGQPEGPQMPAAAPEATLQPPKEAIDYEGPEIVQGHIVVDGDKRYCAVLRFDIRQVDEIEGKGDAKIKIKLYEGAEEEGGTVKYDYTDPNMLVDSLTFDGDDIQDIYGVQKQVGGSGLTIENADGTRVDVEFLYIPLLPTDDQRASDLKEIMTQKRIRFLPLPQIKHLALQTEIFIPDAEISNYGSTMFIGQETHSYFDDPQ